MNYIYLSIFFFFTSNAFAQLSQLEFEEKSSNEAAQASSAQQIIITSPTDNEVKVPRNAAEAEAMERAALEKLKINNSAASSAVMSSSSSSVASAIIEKYNFSGGVVTLGKQHPCSFIPPRLKGPFSDTGNDSSITSKHSWAIPSSKECSSVSDEKSFLGKSLALREVLYRFSGNTDYTELAASNVCAEHCDAKKFPALSEIRLEQGGAGNFAVAVVDGACRYILEKQKDKPWRGVKALNVICNCFDPALAKPAFDSQELGTK